MYNSNSRGLVEKTQSPSRIKLISATYECLNFIRQIASSFIPLLVFSLMIWSMDEQFPGIRLVTLGYVNVVVKVQILILGLIALRLLETGIEKYSKFQLPYELRVKQSVSRLVSIALAVYLFTDLNMSLAQNPDALGHRVATISSFLTMMIVIYLTLSLILMGLHGKIIKQTGTLISTKTIETYKIGFTKIDVSK